MTTDATTKTRKISAALNISRTLKATIHAKDAKASLAAAYAGPADELLSSLLAIVNAQLTIARKAGNDTRSAKLANAARAIRRLARKASAASSASEVAAA